MIKLAKAFWIKKAIFIARWCDKFYFITVNHQKYICFIFCPVGPLMKTLPFLTQFQLFASSKVWINKSTLAITLFWYRVKLLQSPISNDIIRRHFFDYFLTKKWIHTDLVKNWHQFKNCSVFISGPTRRNVKQIHFWWLTVIK